MERSLLTVILSVLIVFFALHSCDRADRPADDNDIVVQQDVEVEESDELDTRIEEFRVDAESQLEEHRRTLEQHRDRLRTEQVDDREEYEQNLIELEHTINDMEIRLDEYEPVGEDDWQQFQQDFNRTMEDIGDSLQDFFNNN